MNAAPKLDPLSMTAAHEYIVTALTSSGSEINAPLWSHVWNPSRPMTIGFPFRWILEKTLEGIRIRSIEGPIDEPIPNPIQEFSFSDLSQNKPISLKTLNASGPSLRLLIQPVPNLDQIIDGATPSAWHPQVIPMEGRRNDENAYRWILVAVAILAILFLVKVNLTPSTVPETTELIPAQYAKVILQSNPKIQRPKERSGSNSARVNNNVVQAFKSNSVQKATRSLFNSTAAKALLSKSKLLDAAGARAQVSKVFGTTSTITGGLKQIEGNTLDPKAAKIGMIGGRGGNGSLGYTSGADGTVAGQGSGLVSFTSPSQGSEEGLTRDEVGRVIREHLKEVRYCYESAIQRNPGLEGKVAVSFTIRANGTVAKASTIHSSGDRGLDNCITSRLMKWAFPKPRGGASVGVSYPFIFKTLNN